MARDKTFWILLGIFQVLFGLAVFGITREYYLERAPVRGTAIPQPQSAAPGWPSVINDRSIDRLTSPSAGPVEPGNPADIARLADEYFSNRQYELAAAQYRRLLDLGPGSADTHNNLGLTLHYLGRSDEALAILHDGIVLDPEHQRIWLTLGFVNAQLGNIEAARTALTRAAQTGSDASIARSAEDMLAKLPPQTESR
jgi:tetratricopeptide (TPR) repeat protein